MSFPGGKLRISQIKEYPFWTMELKKKKKIIKRRDGIYLGNDTWHSLEYKIQASRIFCCGKWVLSFANIDSVGSIWNYFAKNKSQAVANIWMAVYWVAMCFSVIHSEKYKISLICHISCLNKSLPTGSRWLITPKFMRSICRTYNVEFSKSTRTITQVRYLTPSRCVYMASRHLELDYPGIYN